MQISDLSKKRMVLAGFVKAFIHSSTTTMKTNDTIAAILPPFEITDVEKSLFYVGISLIGIGLLLVILCTAIEYCTINRQVYRTMVIHDAMIRPPRCDTKAREVGMQTGTNWRQYFYRDEPFYET